MFVGKRRHSTALYGLLFIACSAALAWLSLTPRSSRAESADIDPKAVAALTRSVAYLRELPAFSVVADVTQDEIVHGNFNLKRLSKVRVTVRRPDHLRAEITGDLGKRLFIYDGKTLSLYLEKEGYYASAEAPATLRETLDAAILKHKIELPLTDLIYAAMGGDVLQNVREAGEIGPRVVDGHACLHEAFRGPTVDWQVWVEDSSKPLPCMLAITTTDAPTHPQYSAKLSWDTSTPVNDELFQFVPPQGALPISLGPASLSTLVTKATSQAATK